VSAHVTRLIRTPGQDWPSIWTSGCACGWLGARWSTKLGAQGEAWAHERSLYLAEASPAVREEAAQHRSEPRAYLASLVRMDLRKRQRGLDAFVAREGQGEEEAEAIRRKFLFDLWARRDALLWLAQDEE